jgi:hypothetical protein
MKLISHRGNINGKKINEENQPEYIDNAILQKYDVEIDIWIINKMFYLGHDKPEYLINQDWLEERKEKLWIHCKNIDAVEWFSENKTFHFFWHQNDTLTLTSRGLLWVFPGNQPIKNSVAVLPEIENENVKSCFAICSDYISKYL